MKAKNPYSSIIAPLSKKSSRLTYQVAIFVPSTNLDKKVPKSIYDKRIEETRIFLDTKGGGDTTSKASGGYLYEENKSGKKSLIKEDITIVETSMTKEQYQDSKKDIENFIVKKKKNWKQDSIGYKFEEDLYIYPKFN